MAQQMIKSDQVRHFYPAKVGKDRYDICLFYANDDGKTYTDLKFIDFTKDEIKGIRDRLTEVLTF